MGKQEDGQRIETRLSEIDNELSYFSTRGIGSPLFKLLGLVGIGAGMYEGVKVKETIPLIYEIPPDDRALAFLALTLYPVAMIAGGIFICYVSHWSKKEDTKRANELNDEARELKANPIYQSLEKRLQNS